MYGAQQRQQMQAPSNPLAIKTKKYGLEKNKYIKDKVPANADLPKVINSGVRALLSNPNAIFVAGGVNENIKIPINPNIKPLFSLFSFL